MNRQHLPRIAISPQASRCTIACVAIIGVLETVYLTVAEFAGKAADLCPTSGCKEVLNSPYSHIFGLPLTLFGFLAYATVAILAISPWLISKKPQRRRWEQNSWLLLLAVTTCMAVSSAYLMYVMLFKIEALCPYCLASASFSTILFLVTIMGHHWHNLRQLVTIIAVTMIISLSGVVAVYANVDYTASQNQPDQIANKAGEKAPEVTTESSEAEIALAEHLQAINAKVYVAYTCPHCYEQKQLFGKQAASMLKQIECHPQGENAQPELCEAAGIQGVPTWEINGEFYAGVQPLERLAEISEYTGSQEFIHKLPY